MTAFLENSPASQRARLMDALRCGQVTRSIALECLGISALGNRISELRRDGHAIRTERVWQPTDSGLRSEAHYALVPTNSHDAERTHGG